MRKRVGSYEHAYSLTFGGGGEPARAVEFRGESVGAALVMARLYGEGREGELFEDGCSLGSIRLDAAGFWVITPPVTLVATGRYDHDRRLRQPIWQESANA